MKVPNYEQVPFLDENGNMSAAWQNVFNQLFQELQINFSDLGLVAPTQDTVTITTLESGSTNGTLLYDETTNELKVRLNDGTFHVIQTL